MNGKIRNLKIIPGNMRYLKKTVFIVAMLMAAATFANAQETAQGNPTAAGAEKENLAARKAFSDARFGIFIHWGIYSMLGHGEWVMNNENINYKEYAKLARGFYPAKFDAKEWARIFKASGAKYVTFTSRHHDGFSMFDSKASNYNIVEATPFGRDVLKELADACRDEGIALHLYYSHLDWGRTDYWPRGRTGNGTGRPDGKDGDWNNYLEFMNKQLTELLTGYGPIGAIWFDGMWDKNSEPREQQSEIWNLTNQYNLIHRFQPACLVGNNHHLLPFEGEDMQIFERDIPGHNEAGLSGQDISQLPLETCQTLSQSWGYQITDRKFKSVDNIIKYLVRTAGKGANLLLNVGPRPDGTLPEEAVERLEDLGKWLEKNGESIYGTEGGCIPEQAWGVTTQRDNDLFVHILSPEKEILLPLPEGRKVLEAKAFIGGEKIPFRRTAEGTVLQLPDTIGNTADYIVTVKLSRAKKK